MTEIATSRTRRPSPPPLRFEGEVAYIDPTRGREAVVDHEDATRFTIGLGTPSWLGYLLRSHSWSISMQENG